VTREGWSRRDGERERTKVTDSPIELPAELEDTEEKTYSAHLPMTNSKMGLTRQGEKKELIAKNHKCSTGGFHRNVLKAALEESKLVRTRERSRDVLQEWRPVSSQGESAW